MRQQKTITIDKIGVIILTHNNYEDTYACVKSILSQDYPNAQILIVDNASTDDSIERLKEQFKNCDFLINGRNLYWAKGINSGVQKLCSNSLTAPKWFVLLNNDVIFYDKQTISKLVASALKLKADIVAPQSIYPDGTLQTDWLSLYFPRAHDIFMYNKLLHKIIKNPSSAIKVDWVPNGYTLFAQKTLKDYPLPEDFPMYYNDVAYCYPIRNLANIYFLPDIKVIHINNYPNQAIKTLAIFKLAKKSEIQFIHKYYTKTYCFFYLCCQSVGSLLRAMYLLCKSLFVPTQFNKIQIYTQNTFMVWKDYFKYRADV